MEKQPRPAQFYWILKHWSHSGTISQYTGTENLRRSPLYDSEEKARQGLREEKIKYALSMRASLEYLDKLG